MDLTPYIDSLREDLATTASAGDEQTRRAAAVLSAALEPAMRLAFMNALADVAAEVTSALDDHVVEVKLAGRDVQVVVTPTRRAADPEPEQPLPPPGDNSAENISRMTLRMFEQIKSQAEQAAAAQGVSLNTFVSQAVQGALRRKWSGHQHRHDDEDRGGPSSRVHGWTEGQ
ncbi:toxin-antitoxin system HicB family antitoxin [Kibdelosporangium philippinense]|uniref:Toxin-antitoxin system HicB family antitoxin n=1 Tax=Kibdelosporangium philippinense TaxID=211113 RepID=A0ABS8ZJ94_9PSEU|nr:toxin-antitoxin system HicB family antitoxin [Kibdelosporangium philippinense]MCE7007567.1 toxin-antitoxin system HicB family antitoxin [Kibdelosporangium philippinense]